MNHEDELLGLVDELARLQFQAGQVRSAIARHVATIAILRDAAGEMRRPSPVGPSPGPTRQDTPIVMEQPAFSTPRVAKRHRGSSAEGTTAAFDPSYRPQPQSPAWRVEQALLGAGGRAPRGTIARAVSMPDAQLGNAICNLRRRGVMVPFAAAAGGLLELTPDYLAVVQGEAVAS